MLQDWDFDLGCMTKFFVSPMPIVMQVLVTPHSAFLTHEALRNIASTTIHNISSCVLGKPLGPDNLNEVFHPARSSVQ